MAAQKYTVSLGTGPRGCGKSTQFKLIEELANDPRVKWWDTSTIIGWHMDKKTAIGLQLLEHKTLMAGGKVMPGVLVHQALTEYLDAWNNKHGLFLALLAGSTRSVEETERWKATGIGIGSVLIHASQDQVQQGVHDRQKTSGQVRLDEGAKELKDAWADYHNLIIPGARAFGECCVETHRSEPMRVRMTKTIAALPVPERVRVRWLQRLNAGNNPVSIKVDILDGVIAPPAVQKQPSMSQPVATVRDGCPHHRGMCGKPCF